MFVQFSDSIEKIIVACFGNAQDPDIYPNQGTVGGDDPRYTTFFNSLPTSAQAFSPALMSDS